MSEPMPHDARMLAIIGSSRPDGNTRLLLDTVIAGMAGVRVADLSKLKIGPFAYDHSNADDDFAALSERVMRVPTIILATPVYWYAMSAQMKTFFDRLTDLTRFQKEKGRALAGKRLFVVATSSNPQAPDGFETPFAGTAGYLGMRWGGLLHGYFKNDLVVADDVGARARRFADLINGGPS